VWFDSGAGFGSVFVRLWLTVPNASWRSSSRPYALHDSLDPLHVDRRAALFTALTSEHRMNAAVAVSGLSGDQRLDLGDKRCLGLWTMASPLSGPSPVAAVPT